jgi:hypothetical protein
MDRNQLTEGDRVQLVADNLSEIERDKYREALTQTGRVVGFSAGGSKLMVVFPGRPGVMFRREQVVKATKVQE